MIPDNLMLQYMCITARFRQRPLTEFPGLLIPPSDKYLQIEPERIEHYLKSLVETNN